MTLSRPHLILLAAGGSAAAMLGALAFQYVGDMPPCKLCYWQRYPHVAAIAIGVIALMVPGRFWPLMGGLAALTTAAIGLYHTGVERKLWAGPASCTSSDNSGLSTAELMDKIMNAPIVRCDEAPWELFTLSMASWNAIFSLGLVLVWVLAAKTRV